MPTVVTMPTAVKMHTAVTMGEVHGVCGAGQGIGCDTVTR